jgi:Mor family transcriptional regulator
MGEFIRPFKSNRHCSGALHAPLLHAPLLHAPLLHAPLLHAPIIKILKGKTMSDIISSIIDTLKESIADITPEQARDIEIAVRKRWGGEQAYISKRCALVDSKIQTINIELRAGHSIAQIEHKHEIPRSTIYRIINHNRQVKKWRD